MRTTLYRTTSPTARKRNLRARIATALSGAARGQPRRVVVALGLLAAAVALAVGSAGATPGALDASFGSGGTVTTAIGGQAAALAVALQHDGKIVAAGPGFFNTVFALARYRANGSLDASFGSAGTVTTNISPGEDKPYAIALQGDGKIVVAGSSQYGDQHMIALARYKPNGTLDARFGNGGTVTTAIGVGHQDYAYAVVVQADGKIVVAGSSSSISQDLFALARYNANGTIDTSFGSGGTVTTAVGLGDVAYALAIQPDGKIVVAGSSWNNTQSRFALARYNSDGTLDTSFGSGGTITTAIGIHYDRAQSLVLQPDGKIVVAGFSLNDQGRALFALARYDTNGTLDPAFGSGGTVTTTIGTYWALALGLARQVNGKLVAAGWDYPNSTTDTAFALARYNPDGTLDSAFGSGGTVTTQTWENGGAAALALQPDGRIVATGFGSGAFALARYLGDTTCVVPRVKNKTLAASKRAIGSAHCSLGRVRKAYAAKVKKGHVVSQSPPPGRVLVEGGKVSLTISKGKRR
jgi:uncharacterized delta-60 repeat protein